MRKSVYFIMAAFLLCECLACTNNSRPFKEVVEFVMDGHVKIYECETKREVENLLEKLNEETQLLLKKMGGKTISIKAEDGLGVQVVSNEGVFLEGYEKNMLLAFPFNFDIKISDAEKAFASLDHLCVVFYNDREEAIYIKDGIDEPQTALKDGLEVDTDSVEVVDYAETVAVENIPNPYKDGEILHKGVFLSMSIDRLPLLVDVSKAVIERWTYEKALEIRKRGDQMRQEYIDKVRENMKDWMKNGD